MTFIKLTTLILCTGLTAFSATSCTKEKGPVEKAGSKIDDALDQRPGEKVRDAVEDVVE